MLATNCIVKAHRLSYTDYVYSYNRALKYLNLYSSCLSHSMEKTRKLHYRLHNIHLSCINIYLSGLYGKWNVHAVHSIKLAHTHLTICLDCPTELMTRNWLIHQCRPMIMTLKEDPVVYQQEGVSYRQNSGLFLQ